MRVFLASALCTILTTATGLGQSQTISATGHVVVDFEPEWAQMQVPVCIKGDYQSESVKRRLQERCDTISALMHSICDTTVTVWYAEPQRWFVCSGRRSKLRGLTRDIHFLLRDLGCLATLEQKLKDMGIDYPRVYRVGLHNDTTALKFVIARAADQARVQAEAAAAPLGATLGKVAELKANPSTQDFSGGGCGMTSQDEIAIDFYGYARPPVMPSHLPKVRIRGRVFVTWSIG